jgi:Mg-chelatase subunit ChlD
MGSPLTETLPINNKKKFRIRGLMGSGSSFDSDDDDCRNKLQLSKEAIIKLYNNLESDDRIGLCTFNGNAQEIFGLTYKNELNIESKLADIKHNGSTVISAGMECGIDIIEKGKISDRKCIKRIILITDMGNDAEENENLKNLSIKHQVLEYLFQ